MDSGGSAFLNMRTGKASVQLRKNMICHEQASRTGASGVKAISLLRIMLERGSGRKAEYLQSNAKENKHRGSAEGEPGTH